jgi:putative nucleotidyltransferase with HDIG domain
VNELWVYSAAPDSADELRDQLAGIFKVQHFDSVRDRKPAQYTLVDVSLRDTSHLFDLKEWLKQKPKGGKAIFVTDKASRIEDTRAYAIGATDLIHRPIDARLLLAKLWGDFDALSGDASEISAQEAPGVKAAVGTLRSIFSSACLGGPIDAAAVDSAGGEVVDQLEAKGLAAWIDTVRAHHSQTYQHCLLVTGLAVAFGQHLGLTQKDRRRLSVAGMLHDVGKARIPVAILEKPGPLDKDELAIMRQHPQYGFDALATMRGLHAEMVDMVIHHHEYLDGSGYPHGIQGSEISDLVRIMTISDVFGALIERRSYKPPLSGEAAYQILLDMGPKLDKDLVREFRFAAKLGRSG